MCVCTSAPFYHMCRFMWQLPPDVYYSTSLRLHSFAVKTFFPFHNHFQPLIWSPFSDFVISKILPSEICFFSLSINPVISVELCGPFLFTADYYSIEWLYQFSLINYPLKDIWVTSSLRLSQIKLPWRFLKRFLGEQRFSFLWDKCPISVTAELHDMHMFSFFFKCQFFSSMAYHFTIMFSASLPTFETFNVFALPALTSV